MRPFTTCHDASWFPASEQEPYIRLKRNGMKPRNVFHRQSLARGHYEETTNEPETLDCRRRPVHRDRSTGIRPAGRVTCATRAPSQAIRAGDRTSQHRILAG